MVKSADKEYFSLQLIKISDYKKKSLQNIDFSFNVICRVGDNKRDPQLMMMILKQLTSQHSPLETVTTLTCYNNNPLTHTINTSHTHIAVGRAGDCNPHTETKIQTQINNCYHPVVLPSCSLCLLLFPLSLCSVPFSPCLSGSRVSLTVFIWVWRSSAAPSVNLICTLASHPAISTQQYINPELQYSPDPQFAHVVRS